MYIPFEDGEVVLAQVHRHWIFIAGRVLLLIGFLILPVLIVWAVQEVGAARFVISGGAELAFWALWGLVAWSLFWRSWTTYYLDIWIVTNRRIIDIDYERLFDRDIAMLRLDKVQDVTTRVRGIMGTLLKYGSVTVQTAGSDREFVIDQIADPEKLRDVIVQASGATPSGA